ncbi:MAG: hypothetical protein ONB48_21145 [candidate division KSB1 bacterium]|nr:hypothetical protein [candidate division KSB1 bacterium]MDZ7288156.1 hypothetical protein [candidate division KSB1 bacterium]MDZ7300331.1 hypothetical protein [candidate division KSB1 bacterium]MDZ7306144.1 hypothetical protein [candidate division KSB1 bacterium]MDZ7351331.1 hypothetical protein [candidate division KSB1 bacterium]
MSFFLSLTFSGGLFAQATPPDSLPESLALRQFKFAAVADTVTLALPDSFIITQSDTLFCGADRLPRGPYYRIDYGRARLTWLGGGTACDSLVLRYHILPVQLPVRLSLYQIQPARPDSLQTGRGEIESLVRTTPLTTGLTRTPGSNLVKRGSLTRGLSLGTNQALTVDSGLRMQIAGQIAEGVEVVASLTDQNTPIQPEGNTQTLQEIDKVYVQLRSPNFNATLGDFEIAYDGSTFARYSRKLQGARFSLGKTRPPSQTGMPPHFELTLSAAVSKGQFATNEFNGTEGNQGPYQLKGERGQIDIIVLGGSERVWLDGELLTRGENNDYVIEYASGQITFTRRRLITADSRITVDFQYSDERFRRNLYSGQGLLSALQDKVKWQTTVLYEGDDKNNPLGFTLGREEAAALAQAGDHLAVRESAVQVTPPARGDYIRLDSTIVIYKYVGRDSGNYRVTFSDVGEGRGDYRFHSFGHYEFVGKNQGRYLPVILLTPARSHALIDNRLSLEPWQGVSLINELALSRRDQNLYSGRDDEDNNGRAWFTALQVGQRPLRVGKSNWGQVALQLNYRNKNARYRDLDRSEVVEFNRKWNLTASHAVTAEDLLEGTMTWLPAAGWRWQGNLGRLTRGRSQASARWELDTELRRPGWPELRYKIENITREEKSAGTLTAAVAYLPASSGWLRQRGTLTWKLGRWTPLTGYEAENREDIFADSTGGFRFRSVTAGLGVAISRHLSLQTSRNERRDETRTRPGLQPASTSRTQNYALDVKQWHALALNFNFTHRERVFAGDTIPATRSDLADLRVTFAPFRRALNTDWQYQITNTQASQQQRVFFKVEQGRGNYRYDPGQNEYIPDPLFGDHVLRLVNTGRFVPVAEVRLRSNIRLTFKELFPPRQPASGPSRRSWWTRLLLPLSLNTFLRLEEKTQDPQVWQIYRLNLSRFQNEKLTLYGTQSVQQEIHLWENRREQSLRYRLTALRERNNQLLDEGARRTQVQHEWRLTWALSPRLTSLSEFKLNREDRIFDTARRLDRLVRSRQVEVELSYRPQPQLELANRSGVALDRDLYADATRQPLRAQALFLRPRLAYALRGRGRLQGEVEWVRVSAEPAGQVLPYELAKGNREGTTWRWNLSAEYRVSNNVNFSATYFGRCEPDLPQTLHLGKVEMRAFF